MNEIGKDTRWYFSVVETAGLVLGLVAFLFFRCFHLAYLSRDSQLWEFCSKVMTP